MRFVFADTGYWIALIDPDDDLHDKALRVTAGLGDVTLVTSAFVLAEVLNHFSGYGPTYRRIAAVAVQTISDNPKHAVFLHTDDFFDLAVARYRQYSDKEWGLTDCYSFLLMEKERIYEALAYDHHFQQAGFRALLREQG